jgi:maltose O-acetyltransferase
MYRPTTFRQNDFRNSSLCVELENVCGHNFTAGRIRPGFVGGFMLYSARHAARKLIQSLCEDFVTASHGVIINRVAGSMAMPRIGRFLIYRLFGLKVRSPNIFYGVRFTGNRVSIGKNTFVNTSVQFEDVAPIRIGDDCQIGMEVLFVTSHHEFHDGILSKDVVPLPIEVGNRCWVGARATILPGVSIGDGCVIAAGAVVAKSCEPQGLYAGIPARRVRDLDPSKPRGIEAPGIERTVMLTA